MKSPLEGLRVLDLSWGFAGTLTSLVLADYGAEVVKVERPGGDPERRHPAFPLWYRGKKSTVLDLKDPAGRQSARRLAAASDILVETFRPGVAERLGLGFAQLGAENPGLVYCSITGFGTRGRYASLKGYEGIVMAKTGAMAKAGPIAPRKGPAFPAIPYASFSAAQAALQGILAALYVRERTGRGQQVEATLVQGFCSHDPWEWFTQLLCEKYPDAFAAAPRVSSAGSPLTPYIFLLLVAATRDGRWVQFSQAAPHLFRALVAALGLERIWQDPAFVKAPEFAAEEDASRFWELLLGEVRKKTLEEWLEAVGDDDNVGFELFRTISEAMDHPQIRHNRHVIELDDPRVGRTRQLGALVEMPRTPARVRSAAPNLGEHDAEVRSRIGGYARPAVKDCGRLPARALEGVTVLELGLWYAAPFGPTLLADLGARVIKVEPLEGDPIRYALSVPESAGVKVLQGKESVALNLERAEGQEIVHRIARRVDLVMMSFRAGVAERLHVDYQRLRRENPRIIYLNAPAYGTTGPYARKPAFAPTIGAAIGGAVLQAGPSPPPDESLGLEELKERSLRLGLAAMTPGNADGCGALGVATGLLLGLVARERTGESQEILATMLCSTAYALSHDFIEYAGKPPPAAPDPMLYGLHALYRLYEAAEGWVFLACPQPSEWQGLCRAARELSKGEVDLGEDPRFATAQARARNDAALALDLGRFFRERQSAEWEGLLAGYDVGCADVNLGSTAKFATSDPIMTENGFLAEVEHPLFGRHVRLAPIVRLSLTPGAPRPAPTAGMHTESVLVELGYGREEIAELAARKVIR